jgi:hypothetical protein
MWRPTSLNLKRASRLATFVIGIDAIATTFQIFSKRIRNWRNAPAWRNLSRPE